MLTSNERIWELWISVLGILNGPVFAVLLMAVLLPFIPHSVRIELCFVHVL